MSADFHISLSDQLSNLKLIKEKAVNLMESLFLLAQEDRTAFLQHILQSFGSTYICLWTYLPPPSNCLLFLDGVFKEEGLHTRLFSAYCESVNYIDHGRVPGFAFKNNIPYMEMKQHDLQRLASSQMQTQFYQEAGIKTVVFMGCAAGEIELGISTELLQVDLETELKRWFPLDNFSRSSQKTTPPPIDQITSNNSSTSLSVESIEYSSSSLFTINTEAPNILSTNSSPHDQSVQALGQIRSTQFPTMESEDDVMTRAILAVLSSPSSTSQQNLPPINISPSSHRSAAFTRYNNNNNNNNNNRPPALAPVAARTRKNNNMFRRSVLFFRNLNMRRRQEMQIQGNYPPNPTQLHHMISERKRREKLNESFQVLRSLLPPGSKKDKASVLSSTTEYLSSLKSQVEQISKRNQILEKQLSKSDHQTVNNLGGVDQVGASTTSSRNDRRVNVEIEHVAASTSEARFLDLRVNLRSGECTLVDLVIWILELLKQQRVVSLLSVQSNTTMVESIPVHGLVLRLKVEGDEFDESSFQEAVRRVVDDQTH